ncbi:hypothetical protein B0H17DRAFT_1084469 [Mycena rosella]|uniref:Uncharacterized protein n=1 Tax=Mycena rosella TaxID=1033263 RepID=A0AAD7D034_MYCRO|nr:hypothetical protein B0H17DRAFT_1084469 [Mycena rosella]
MAPFPTSLLASTSTLLCHLRSSHKRAPIPTGHFEAQPDLANLSSNSIDPRARGPTSPQAEADSEESHTLFTNDIRNQSIVHLLNAHIPSANIPYASPEAPGLPFAAYLPDMPETAAAPELPRRPSVILNETAPRPSQRRHVSHGPYPPNNTAGFFRSDPATDRAAAAVRDCRELAREIHEILARCGPLLQVSRSIESCRALDGIFAALVDALQPSHSRHVCAPLRICAHEGWHTRHEGKLEELSGHLARFLADFRPPTPERTSELTAKFARHTDNFRRLQAVLERSWIRLDYAVMDAALKNCSDTIEAAERDLRALRLDHGMLRRRRESLRGEFEAMAPGHPE